MTECRSTNCREKSEVFDVEKGLPKNVDYLKSCICVHEWSVGGGGSSWAWYGIK